MKSKSNYHIDLDIMRVIASIAVVLIHVSAQNWYSISDIRYYTVLNFYDSIARFAVPLFLMISGTLFLGVKKEINIKKFFHKHIIKIVFVYLIWSLFYYFVDVFLFKKNIMLDLKSIIYSITNSKYVLWYLKVLIYIYLFMPLIKIIITNSSETQIKYFLMIFFILGIVTYHLSNLILPDNITYFFNNMRISNEFWYVGYFVLGWYLYNLEIKKNIRKYIYLIGVASCAICFLFTSFYFYKTGIKTELLYNYFSLTTFLYSISIFIFIKNSRKNKFSNAEKLQKLSSKTFGIYLVHVFVIEMLDCFSINVKMVNPIISVPFLTVLVYLISYIITFILQKLPIAKKIV